MLKNFAERKFGFEEFSFWCFTLGTAFSALGPVFHYTGWLSAIAALLYGKLRYKTNLFSWPQKQKDGRTILYILLAAFIWSLIANAFGADSFSSWGRSASIPLELLIAVFLAMRLLESEETLDKFATLIIIGGIISNFYFIFITPLTLKIHGNIVSGNALGIYNILILPVFFCYALWRNKKGVSIAILLCLASMFSLLSNFSTGPWIAGLIEIIVISFCAIKNKKLSVGLLVKIVLAFFIILLVCAAQNKNISDKFTNELTQLSY
ncbi:MAG: hypothetical protein Q4F74_04145, partial [Synergistaceae bacterium]|nr:hypothetical protein [Synergistaceae bacterium]